MKDKITFHASWLDAIEALDEGLQGKVLLGLVRYGFGGELPADALISAFVNMARPQMDADNARYENAKKGGAPKGNTNAKKDVEDVKKQPKTTIVDSQKQPSKQPKSTIVKGIVDLGGTIGGSTTTTIENNYKTIEDEVVVDDLHARLCAETVWLEAVCMNLRKDLDYIHRRLEEFCTEQKVQGVTAKSLTDAKKHFRSWLRKVEQIESEQSRRGEPTNNGRPYPIFSYEEMLAEAQRKGGTTNDYAPVRLGNNPKPMWVRLTDKTKYNIPDKIES